jgi:adenine-specific DNA-methyltransferase
MLDGRPVVEIRERWSEDARVVLHRGDTRDLLRTLPDACAQLVITSPPYNLAKEYERRRLDLEEYVHGQQEVIGECTRILRPGGSLCWEVGNHVADDEIVPLDLLLYPVFRRHAALKLRNRVVWHFEHGLHCTRRFSGRHEVILWFTKGVEYAFDVDPVRVPQKYPGKRAWKGPRAGEYTGNPKGKNPGDVWIFPNVKANHVEKTIHPCQFPVELVERFILTVTQPGDLVVDPFMGVGTTACAAVLHGRRAAGAEALPAYVEIARERIRLAAEGSLQTRPRDRPVHRPDPDSALARRDPALQRIERRRGKRTPPQGLRIGARADAEQLRFGPTLDRAQSRQSAASPPSSSTRVPN